jgi:acetyl-CoA acetyltransferase
VVRSADQAMTAVSAIHDRTAIVGIGQTEYSAASGKSEIRLCLDAILAALGDAGLSASDVDGLVRFGLSQTNCSEPWVAHNLGIPELRFWGSIDLGGAAACALISHAASAVAAGLAETIVCYRALNGSSGRRPGTSDTLQLFDGQDPMMDAHITPQGLGAPVQFFSLLARRHMHEYGTTHEQLAEISVAFREHANRNPCAQMHSKSLTREECAEAPVIASPLRRYDCCLQTDGAAAFVITSAERAAALRKPPVYIKGAGQSSLPGHYGPLWSILLRSDLMESPSRALAQRLYKETGFEPAMIDVAQLYDCFTITALVQLEEWGFCAKGEGGPLAASGALTLDGELPANTAGGNLSEGYLHGVNHILEGVRQLRGESTSQVVGAQVCLVTAGTPTPTSAAILGSERG